MLYKHNFNSATCDQIAASKTLLSSYSKATGSSVIT